MKKSFSCLSFVLGLFGPLALWADQTTEDVVLATFEQVDVDGNGYLSKTEVKAKTDATRGLAVSEYGGFELADINGDRQLNAAEFAAFEEELPAE